MDTDEILSNQVDRSPMQRMLPWDVVVVGGGAAGLSAALTLGRARRRVLVLDSGAPRNRFTEHMHGVLGRDGTAPARLLADGRREVESYGGVVLSRSAAAVAATEETGGPGFTVALDTASDPADDLGGILDVRTRRLLVATGARDELPALAGLDEWWGRGVAVCPYCDAYEVADRPIGILATGPGSVMQAQLLRQWSGSIVYLADAVGAPHGQDRADLESRGIEVIEGPVERVLATGSRRQGGRLAGVRMVDGRIVKLDAIFTIPTLVPADDLLTQLGATTTDGPMGTFVQVDGTGKTSIDGVWAAGNVVNPAANVPISIGAGAMAAGAMNHDLILDDIIRSRTGDRTGV